MYTGKTKKNKEILNSMKKLFLTIKFLSKKSSKILNNKSLFILSLKRLYKGLLFFELILLKNKPFCYFSLKKKKYRKKKSIFFNKKSNFYIFFNDKIFNYVSDRTFILLKNKNLSLAFNSNNDLAKIFFILFFVLKKRNHLKMIMSINSIKNRVKKIKKNK